MNIVVSLLIVKHSVNFYGFQVHIICLTELTEKRYPSSLGCSEKFHKRVKVQKFFSLQMQKVVQILRLFDAVFQDHFSALGCGKAVLNLPFPTSNTLYKLKSIQI